jgi:adenylate kinase
MLAIMLGPPGSGKGTQAAKIAEAKGLVHLSTGDILRSAVKEGTELGNRAKAFMEAGDLVPDQLILDMIKERLQSAGDHYLFDGFPRTIPQAEGLDKMLDELGRKVNLVLDLDVSDQEVINRLSGRYFCPSCQATYNYPSRLPKREGICDKCNVALSKRKDDTEEVVTNRLRVYKEQTQPLQDYYTRQSVLKTVNGERNIDAIFNDLVSVLDNVVSG